LILKLDHVKLGCQENAMVEKLTKVMVEQVHAWRCVTTCITVVRQFFGYNENMITHTMNHCCKYDYNENKTCLNQ